MTNSVREQNIKARRKYQAAHPERVRESARRYREANREKVRAASRKWSIEHKEERQEYRERNKERDTAAVLDWRAANPEKVRAYTRAWTDRHPEKRRETIQSWLQRNPEARQGFNARRRARQTNAPGNGVTREQWRAIKEEYGGRCAYCAVSAKLTMDHVEPLSEGGAHDVANVVPACRPCNSSKHTKPLIRWLRDRTSREGSVKC